MTVICGACDDSHVMTLRKSSGDEQKVPCTRCPVPCDDCRGSFAGGGYTAYCAEVPCDCPCHMKKEYEFKGGEQGRYADMAKKKEPTKIKPLDYAQCQAEIREGVSARNFMQMGGKIGGVRRCTNQPTVVVTEKEPSPKDGLIGHMTLCDGCLTKLKEQSPKTRTFAVTKISMLMKKRWAELDPDTRRIFEAHGLKCP